MKKIEKKLARFLELSKKFSKTDHEVLGDYENILKLVPEKNYTVFNNYTGLSLSPINEVKNLTRKEEFEEATKQLLILVNEREEYKKLQNELSEYYTAKQNLKQVKDE